MGKFSEVGRKAQEEYVEQQLEQRLAEYTEDERRLLDIFAGRLQATFRISHALMAEGIRAVEHIQKTKLYRARYENFVDFLKHCGLPNITKYKYYESKNLLDKETDEVYDVLTLAGIPQSVRSEFPPGSFQIDGGSLIVKGVEGEDIVVDRENPKGLENAVRKLSDSIRQTREKLEFVEQKLATIQEKHGEEIAAKDDELAREKASKAADIGQDPHMIAYVEAQGAFRSLITAAGNLSDIEKGQFGSRTLETLAAQMQDLASAYREKTWTTHAPNSDLTTGDPYMDDLLNRVDDDNDAELTAKIGGKK